MDKKKIRLTESQLIDLIKKSLVVEQATLTSGNGTFEKPFIDTQLIKDVDTLVDDLDGIVNSTNIASMLTIIKKYVGKVAYDDTDPSSPQKVSACLRISQLYEIDESGDTLEGDINSVTTRTVGFEGVKNLQQLKTVLANCMAETPAPPVQQQTNQQTNTVAQENKFYCVENVSGYKAETNRQGKQFANVPWKGGNLSFWFDASSIGNPTYPEHNILYEKGGKKWTAKGECKDTGAGVQGGLTFGKWEPKTN